ncbi:MAG: T9SS type A sorting domain-containing protein [Flavobacteriales bacterium]|nr:T9SS type A sorting domain-containing protein [Flavobacteriales bacterium]
MEHRLLHPLYLDGRIFVPAVGTGIEEMAVGGFRVVPNPTHALITLTLAGPGQARYITLLDATGRTVLEQPIANVNGPITMDLSGHDNGLYFVQVAFTGGTRAVQRVVKE